MARVLILLLFVRSCWEGGRGTTPLFSDGINYTMDDIFYGGNFPLEIWTGITNGRALSVVSIYQSPLRLDTIQSRFSVTRISATWQ